MKPAGSAAAGNGQVFLARTPIFSRRKHVLGYRITAGRRTGQPPGGHDDEASQVAQVFAATGPDMLTHRLPAFVRVTPDGLLDGTHLNLPADRVVLELDADAHADWDVVDVCIDARSRGFRLALDDFTVSSRAAGLVPRVDYLKIDVRDPRSAESRARTVACFRQAQTILIATGVDTHAELDAAAQDGFECLEGFFFQEPEAAVERRMQPQQLTLLRLLRALNDPNLSISDLEDLVKHDAGLCYRILRAVNSAAAARRHQISSMHDALLLLGRDMVRRWASICTVAGLSTSAHSELIVMSTVRARLCELLVGTAPGGVEAGEAFLLGMCSLFDTILGRPMKDLVNDLPLGLETRQALAGEATPARAILDCVIAYEHGNWERCETLARQARVNPNVMPGAFLEAIRWAGELNAEEGRSSEFGTRN